MKESRQEETGVREDPSGCQSRKREPVGEGHELSRGVVPKHIAILEKPVPDWLWNRPGTS